VRGSWDVRGSWAQPLKRTLRMSDWGQAEHRGMRMVNTEVHDKTKKPTINEPANKDGRTTNKSQLHDSWVMPLVLAEEWMRGVWATNIWESRIRSQDIANDQSTNDLASTHHTKDNTTHLRAGEGLGLLVMNDWGGYWPWTHDKKGSWGAEEHEQSNNHWMTKTASVTTE